MLLGFKISFFCSDNENSQSKINSFTKEEYAELMSVYPQIVEDITSIEPYNKLPNLLTRVKFFLDYTFNSGNNAYGMLIPYVYKNIAKPDDKKDEHIKKALILAWVSRMVSYHSFKFQILYEKCTETNSLFNEIKSDRTKIIIRYILLNPLISSEIITLINVLWQAIP